MSLLDSTEEQRVQEQLLKDYELFRAQMDLRLALEPREPSVPLTQEFVNSFPRAIGSAPSLLLSAYTVAFVESDQRRYNESRREELDDLDYFLDKNSYYATYADLLFKFKE